MHPLQKCIIWLQKIWSYILPYQVKKIQSQINGVLKVRYIDGKKRLDARDSNYSFGSVTPILKKGLEKIRFGDDTWTILLLGLWWGSVIETIRETFHSRAYIEVVEIDPLMIEVAKQEFGLERFQNVTIVEGDALDYIKNSSAPFDLIIIDIFINNVTPDAFIEEVFLSQLSTHLSQNGYIIFNTMRVTMDSAKVNKIESSFTKLGLFVEVMEKVCGSNTLIIARKN